MATLVQRVKYLAHKFVHASEVVDKAFKNKAIKENEIIPALVDSMKQNLTMKLPFEGDEMVPTLSARQPHTLVVRKIPTPSTASVFVGDVVIFNSPDTPERELVRRVAAIQGEEMLSSDPADESFRIDPNHCWVLCDNEEKKAKEASDSRTFGPLPLSRIFGRALYAITSATDHGPIYNSLEASIEDQPVLLCEIREYITAQQEEGK